MPKRSAGASQTISGFDQVFRPNEPNAKKSMKVTSGATTIAASIGDITSESKGTPRIASPPPNAPLPTETTKIVVRPTR